MRAGGCRLRYPSSDRNPTNVVIPAKAGIHFVYHERATFCFSRRWPKTLAPVAMGSATSCCFTCPAMLAEPRPRRTRTSLCSNM